VTVLQLTTIWQLTVIAGLIAGVLARNFKTAILSGAFGFLASWLFFFLVLLQVPSNLAIALSILPMFFGIGLILTIVLGIVSASIGYFSMAIVDEKRAGSRKAKSKR
jgi:uncharacterized membrane protein YeaQ/YmgE (transglycosylase-associated protein family)